MSSSSPSKSSPSKSKVATSASVKKSSSKGWLFVTFVALFGVVIAVAWPWIEPQLGLTKGGCPWPFNLLHSFGEKEGLTIEKNGNAWKKYTLEDLRKHDGSNPELPILLSISGKVLDVTKGKKFYGPGKTYHQFAGRACTRALALGSLDLNDISDEVHDFNDAQKQELDETLAFYFEKYPQIGVLA